MRFELVDTLDGVLALEREWRELEGRSCCHVFQSHPFVLGWLETAGVAEGARPAVVLCREAGRIAALFPGCTVRRGPLRILTWLGGVYAVDYGDILVDTAAGIDPGAFLEKALAFLESHGVRGLRYLYNVRHDAAAYPWLAANFRPYRDDPAPYIELTGSFEEFLDSLKRFRKKQKSDTLRQIRRLEELAPLEFAVLPPDDPSREEVLAAFVEQKRRRYSATGTDGVLFRHGYADFYCGQGRHHPDAHLCVLRSGGEIIATHLGYLYRDRLYFLMPTFAPEYGRFSPGRVLTWFLLRECFDRGVAVFDFCIGDEEYKGEWTDRAARETSFIGGGLLGELFVWYKRGMRRKKLMFARSRGC